MPNQSLAAVFLILLLVGGTSHSAPIVADPSRFRVELFADFATIDPNLDAFQLTISSGEKGFAPGLYVTPGPSFPPGGNSLMRIDSNGNITTLTTGLHSAESMVFARGPYGDGILISEPRDQRIRRLLPDGTLTTFASVGTAPFGPPVMTYGPSGILFASGGSTGTDLQASRDILQINPDGTSSVFASIPAGIFPAPTAATFLQRGKALASASINAGQWQEGGGLVAGTFSMQSDGGATMNDAVFAIGLDGSATLLAQGLSGLELIEVGLGGAFGTNLFLGTEGSRSGTADGALLTLSPDGTLTPFLTGIDAIDVAFDTQGTLGGGMFVSDGTNRAGAGKIWRVTAIPEPSSALLLIAGIIILALMRSRFLGSLLDPCRRRGGASVTLNAQSDKGPGPTKCAQVEWGALRSQFATV